MNILVVSRGYPDRREPTRGCFEKDQSEALKALGHSVKVLSVDMRFRFYWRTPGITHRVINGIDYYDFLLLPGILLRYLTGRKCYGRVRQWMLLQLAKRVITPEWTPDIIYSHYYWNTGAASAIKKKYGIPLVGMEHSSEMGRSPMKRDTVLDGRDAYENVDRLLSVSGFLRDRIRDQFGIDSDVVPNMLSPEFMEDCNRGEESPLCRFISVGSLFPVKGYDMLIKAFAKSSLPKDKWRLDIVGGGRMKGELDRLVRDLGLEENIHLVGPKGKEEIARMFRGSDVYLLASRLETFGVACIEALSQGLPCIATDCGGPKGIIDETNGLMVPVDDLDALSEAICYMAEHHCEYDRARIRRDTLRKFAPEIVAARLQSIFEEVLKKKN